MNSLEIIKLNNLQLASRLVSEELSLGIHQSKRIGAGVEFEQYKHYFPGDDLKRIDWKLYARSSKLLVKESSSESNLDVSLILDLSGSMNYQENGVSRLQYAKVLLASLGYLSHRQGDTLRFHTLKNGTLETLVSGGKNAFQNILYHLEKAEASGTWNAQKEDFLALNTKQKQCVVWVTDLLQINNEWIDFVTKIANPRRQILIFQILGNNEINFDLKGFYTFQDLETGKEIELDAETIKKDFLKHSNTYWKDLDLKLKIPNVNLVKGSLNDEFAELISKGLKSFR